MNQRPVHLDLTTLKFPATAIVSILHRISGVVLFLLMPVWLYALKVSLHSSETFHQLKMSLQTPFWKILAWSFMVALTYHLFAGIRHLIMDLGYGESLSSGRRSSILVIVLSAVSACVLGAWIW